MTSMTRKSPRGSYNQEVERIISSFPDTSPLTADETFTVSEAAREELESNSLILKEISSLKEIDDKDRINQLKKLIKDNQSAQVRMLGSVIKLMVRDAELYASVGPEVSVGDMMLVGMDKTIYYAIPKYDPNTGNKWATYCRWWWRAGMARHMKNMKMLEDKRGRDKNRRMEICEEEGITESEFFARQQYLSFNSPLHDNSHKTVFDLACAQHPVQTSNSIEMDDVMDRMNCLLHEGEFFDERETFIYISRQRKGMSMKQCGDIIGISKERVRQIEKGIISRLRCHIEGNKKMARRTFNGCVSLRKLEWSSKRRLRVIDPCGPTDHSQICDECWKYLIKKAKSGAGKNGKTQK